MMKCAHFLLKFKPIILLPIGIYFVPLYANKNEQSEGLNDLKIRPEVSIVPIQSGFRLFEKRQFGIGMYSEMPTHRTADTYEREGLGFLLSYDQWVRAFWSGGLQMKMGSWQLTGKGKSLFQKEGKKQDLASPWSIGTRIQLSPDFLGILTGNEPSIVHKFFRPVAGFSIGFTSFFDSRSFLAKKSRNENTEPYVSYNIGARLLWPKNAALKVVYEWWRGVKTYNYSSESILFEIQFGDVDAI